MPILDKKNILTSVKTDKRKSIILDLGCGPGKKKPEWIGVDMLDFEGVDIVGDIFEILSTFPDESVDEIHAFHFFEHIENMPRLLSECARILKSTGLIEIVVPHFSNAYFYSDYTHKNFFGLYSFSYLVKDNILRRKVPNYQVVHQLNLHNVHLRFLSPFYVTRPFRMLWQLIFNSCNIMKEIYEDSWSRNFPCYEIKYVLKK